MKRYILKLSLYACLWTISSYPIPISKRPAASNHNQVLTTPVFQTSITPLEINTSGTKTISTPGEHYITNHVNFDPITNPADDTILHITTSNVRLNLNGKKISHSSANSTTHLKGIVIDPNLDNIVIYNGSIHDCSGAGIVIGQGCSNISIFNVSILNPGLTGIVIGYDPFDTGTYTSVHQGQERIRFTDPANEPTYPTQDIILENVYVSGAAGYYDAATDIFSNAIGIQIADVKNFQLLNCLSNSNKYSAPDIIKNSSTDPGGHYLSTRSGYNAYGLQCIRCQNGHIENCEASDNQGYMACGFLLERCQSINFINCVAHHNEAEGDPVQHRTLLTTTFDFIAHRDIGRAAGFMLHDSSGNNFVGCSAFYTKGTREAAGFWLRRYSMLSSSTLIPNSQLYDPTIIQDQVTIPGVAANVDIGSVLLLPPTPESIPSIDSGYEPTRTSLYLQHSGSNCNHCTDCQARHTTSTYLGAHGFLSQGNINNTFEKITGQNSVSGIGVNSTNYLLAGGLSDFDTGVDVWSLTEYEQYINSHTNQIIHYATGIALECIRLPLLVWNGTTIELADGGGGDLQFVGTRIQSGPDAYAIPCWAETCSSVCESTLQENYGSCVGSGVGILLNGAYKARIKKNWLYCNHSCSLGVTGDCADAPTGIGALGGYGLLDLATNSTSLIMENLAYANQTLRPKIVTICCNGVSTIGFGNYIEGSNYHVKYSNASLSLPIESASIGDFSPFNILTPFSNFEWECETINPNYTVKDKTLVENVERVFTP